MSYSILLKDPATGKQVIFNSTQQLKYGISEACLNLTYNYTRWYEKNGVFPNNREAKGVRSIYGMSGVESIPILENAINMLEDISEDFKYWVNVVQPLHKLLRMAKMRPDAIWDEKEGLANLTLSNADRIRQMSDEELAVTLMCPAEYDTEFDKNKECNGEVNKNCRKCTLKWLQGKATI